jgi:hypothetical protein
VAVLFIMSPIIPTNYRLTIDNTYSTNANATSVGNSINSTMIAQGRPERAVVTTTNVTLLVVGMTESEAVSLRDALKAAWTGTARTFGKVSVDRTDATG